MRKRNLFFALFAVAALAIVAGQTAKPISPPKVDSGTSLATARTAIQKTAGTEAFPIWLKTYATAMHPTEAMTLFREFIPKAKSSDKAALASYAASLALVAGRLEDAAYFLALPGSSRPDMVVEAVRCNLAMGRVQVARTLLSQLPSEIQLDLANPLLLAKAWLALIEESPERAREIVFPLIQPGVISTSRREALFIAWLALASSQNGAAIAPILAALESEFPLSLEYSLVKGNIHPQPSAWLLEGFYLQKAQAIPPAKSTQIQAQGDSPKDGKESTTAKLQVGWFSRRENAQALTSTLTGKGFLASLDEQTASDGEARWAVIVVASGDWTKTQAQLKDLGYESYLLP